MKKFLVLALLLTSCNTNKPTTGKDIAIGTGIVGGLVGLAVFTGIAIIPIPSGNHENKYKEKDRILKLSFQERMREVDICNKYAQEISKLPWYKRRTSVYPKESPSSPTYSS